MDGGEEEGGPGQEGAEEVRLAAGQGLGDGGVKEDGQAEQGEVGEDTGREVGAVLTANIWTGDVNIAYLVPSFENLGSCS